MDSNLTITHNFNESKKNPSEESKKSSQKVVSFEYKAQILCWQGAKTPLKSSKKRRKSIKIRNKRKYDSRTKIRFL